MSVWELLPSFYSGTLVTVTLLSASLLIGLLLAFMMTLILEFNQSILTIPIRTFIFIIRGTPLLVQIFIIYYGSGQWHALHQTLLWEILKKPIGCGIIALALNTSAYTTVLLRGAIQSVPRGEVEACQALGMSWLTMYRRIILPRAFRLVLPAYSNEVIIILKGTSLVSAISLMDLMGVAEHWMSVTYQTIPILLMTGVIYLALNSLIMILFRFIERTCAFQQALKI